MNKLLNLIVIVTLAIAFPDIGTAQTDEKLTRGNEAARKIPRDSAAPLFKLRPRVKEGDAWCHYDSDTGACTKCPGTDEDCVQSTQPTLNDCFASECPAAPAAAKVKAKKLAGKPGTQESICLYNATQGQCFAAKINPEGGTTGVGASVPDAEACAAHCNANK